ncbi:DNA alkylation repair protein [Cognatishimia activa]|uniref:DNA alkylation repair enzyme n=1 Tax=Cognatishimia activa TaxID=1715691 RepID=A0A0P1IPG2_9RHOB|nr:DNA alkylation repair protein [Cognatishimia activa]CUJ21264.1 DNA alkylation repair enzyme [Cognatishimia activa]CUK25469.1 DNA alkylation repair enzyme [Cognatishimia activa]
MNLEDALTELRALAEPGRAEQMAAYHKQKRDVIGIPNPDINDLTKTWRQTLTVEERVSLASELWATDIFEGRLAASKLLTQARLRPDEDAWTLIQSWVPDFDSWAIADHACMAGQKRLVADPSRLDQVEGWTTSDHMWTRRAALVITLPWTKQNHPKPHELQARDRVLGWAASYVDDHDWFIQKAVAWWIRDLSRHDAARSQAFLDEFGARLKPFARKEAARHLSN